MALCTNCGAEVPAATAICPTCKRFASRSMLKFYTFAFALLAVSILVIVVVTILEHVSKKQPAPAPQSQQAAPSNQPSAKTWCGIPKRNGTIATERACDLEELCKDWVYYRRKIFEYTAEGNAAKAASARSSFQQLNAWLAEYEEKDANACLLQFGG